MNNIVEILKKSSSHGLELFSAEEIAWLEGRIELKKTKTGEGYYTNCYVRNKSIKVTPEEVVRQLYAIVWSKSMDMISEDSPLSFRCSLDERRREPI